MTDTAERCGRCSGVHKQSDPMACVRVDLDSARAEITRLRSALTARDEALKETVRSLENCLMLARREKNRKDTNARTLAAWTHVIRFCDEAGVEGGGILRDENDALSALAAAKVQG